MALYVYYPILFIGTIGINYSKGLVFISNKRRESKIKWPLRFFLLPVNWLFCIAVNEITESSTLGGCLKAIGLFFVIIFGLLFISGMFSEKAPSSEPSTTSTPSEVIAPQTRNEDLAEIVKTDSDYDEYGLKVFCKVKNNSNQLMTYVEYQIVVYNSEGNVIGTGIGNTTNLPSEETRVVTGYVTNISANKIKFETKISSVMF